MASSLALKCCNPVINSHSSVSLHIHCATSKFVCSRYAADCFYVPPLLVADQNRLLPVGCTKELELSSYVHNLGSAQSDDDPTTRSKHTLRDGVAYDNNVLLLHIIGAAPTG